MPEKHGAAAAAAAAAGAAAACLLMFLCCCCCCCYYCYYCCCCCCYCGGGNSIPPEFIFSRNIYYNNACLIIQLLHCFSFPKTWFYRTGGLQPSNVLQTADTVEVGNTPEVLDGKGSASSSELTQCLFNSASQILHRWDQMQGRTVCPYVRNADAPHFKETWVRGSEASTYVRCPRCWSLGTLALPEWEASTPDSGEAFAGDEEHSSSSSEDSTSSDPTGVDGSD